MLFIFTVDTIEVFTSGDCLRICMCFKLINNVYFPIYIIIIIIIVRLLFVFLPSIFNFIDELSVYDVCSSFIDWTVFVFIISALYDSIV